MKGDGMKKKWTAVGITSKCKFCGGQGDPLPVLNLGFGRPYNHYVYAVGCLRCETHTLHGETPAEAVDNWNKQLYSDDTYLLREEHPLTDAGAENLLQAIVADLVNAYLEARLLTLVDDKGTCRKEAKEALRGIKEWTAAAGLSTAGVQRELDRAETEMREECIKAYRAAVKSHIFKRRARIGRAKNAEQENH